MARAHRIAINLPQPLHDYVRKVADRHGMTVTATVAMIIAGHMDTAAKAAGTKPKKGKRK